MKVREHFEQASEQAQKLYDLGFRHAKRGDVEPSLLLNPHYAEGFRDGGGI